jgi:primosomal protein N' (replication factor Y)
LNREQTAAVAAISESIQRREFRSFLLHGVTGSGKTEVYLRAIDQVRKRGLGALIMVPEIGLTPQLTDRIKRRFTSHVAVLHSALSERERLLEWENIHSGKTNIVVGARSSVFAPLKSIGLIVVDEEHDSSYKQGEGFRYNGRDLAVVRARIARCPVILGSATPAIESYYNAVNGRYRLLSLKERIEKRPPPAIEWVDLRKHFAKRPSSLLSSELIDGLKENWLRGRQSLLFLNRRGFAEYLLCTLCGFVFMCPNCSVTLTFHRENAEARCHYCNLSAVAPDTCPQCGSARLKGVGSGTEKVQSELKKLLPHARIGRMDRDTVGRKGAYESILSDWGTAKIDVLVGTQMITKGHDIPGVTLVGVLLADSSLNLPDFRSAEKTFQLVTQVAGRTGRGDEKGRVIVQTFHPDHYVFESVREGDMQRFFEHEIRLRRSLGYPPFTRLAEIRLDGATEANVRSAALRVASKLRDMLARPPHHGTVELVGPAPALISRLRNRFRWHLLLKGKDPQSLRRAITEAGPTLSRGAAPQRIRITVDVDPIDML